MLVSTKDMLLRAQKERYAVANFCVWNVEMLSGVMHACEKLQSPVILSFGSGFLPNTDINHFIHFMRSYALHTALPCSIHWDHGRSFEIVSHAIDIGYNSLVIDGSPYTLEENIRRTKEVVDKFHPLCIPIEGELGHVGGTGPLPIYRPRSGGGIRGENRRGLPGHRHRESARRLHRAPRRSTSTSWRRCATPSPPPGAPRRLRSERRRHPPGH